MFSLVVSDFGIKCQGIQHAKHLKNELDEYYDVSVDWEGKFFCNITLDWNYNMKHVDFSVPGYVQRKLTKLQHPKPVKPQHSPYQASPIVYGEKVQQPVQSEITSPLTVSQIKLVQEIVGAFIWYGQTYGLTQTATLSAISSRQTKGTDAVLAAWHQLIDYLATHPSAAIRYHASDMILAFDTDALYLSEMEGKSRAASYYFMTRKGKKGIHKWSSQRPLHHHKTRHVISIQSRNWSTLLWMQTRHPIQSNTRRDGAPTGQDPSHNQ